MMSGAHVCTVSSSITSAMYFGDQSRACIVGSLPATKFARDFRVEIIDLETATTKATYTIGGTSSAAELCGVLGAPKLFVAVASDNSAGESEGFILEVHETPEEIGFMDPIRFFADRTKGPVSSITYSTQLGWLACCHESGFINIFDINHLENPYVGFMADSTGVNQVRFDRMGRLITAGNSGKQLKVWDLRSSIHSCAVDRQLPVQGVGFTSVCPHPVNDYVFCGTTDGGLTAWDLRTDACMKQDRIHTESTTSVVMHPASYGQLRVVSSSSDGTVVSTDLAVKTTAHEQYPTGFPWAYEYESILVEPASVTSLDVNIESRSLLASTSIGGIFSQSFFTCFK